MANIEWIKNTSGQTIQLLTGRNDISVMNLEAGEIFPYSTLVIDYVDDPNYNKAVIDTYVLNGVLAYLSGVAAGPVYSKYVQNPIVNFIPAIATKVTAGEHLSFLDITTNDPNAWLWTILDSLGSPADITFLDGTTNTSSNPIIQFNTVGEYSVTLKTTISDTDYSITKSKLIIVLAQDTAKIPVANFTPSSLNEIFQGAQISFTDTSINLPTKWSWTVTRAGGNNSGDYEFIEGTTKTSQNPTILFYSLGSYSISLIASNTMGKSVIETKSDIVVVSQDIPSINFTYTPSNAVAGASVQFTDTTTNYPSSWGWNVYKTSGNISISDYSFIGSTEFNQHPVIQFNTAGTYSIRLTARNFTGYGEPMVKTNIITVT